MRTNQKERAENARKFYSIFMDGNCDKAAIVVNRIESSNPNINRCQFVAVPSTLAFMEKPVVIAESVYGWSEYWYGGDSVVDNRHRRFSWRKCGLT